MATRKTTPGVMLDGIDLVALFVKVVEFSPTKSEPLLVQEMNDEMGIDTFAALGVLADAELIAFKTGKVWLNVPDVSEENAAGIANEALVNHPFETNSPKPVRRTKAQIAADKAAESQDGVMSQAPEFADVVPAVEPAKDSAGETVTIPVDFDDPSKGRRELDAAQGERLISEDTYTIRAPKTGAAIKELADRITELTPKTWTPEFYEPKNEPFEGPESIPPVPAGVSENVWFMAHYADTETARDWWMTKAVTQYQEIATVEPVMKEEVAPF